MRVLNVNYGGATNPSSRNQTPVITPLHRLHHLSHSSTISPSSHSTHACHLFEFPPRHTVTLPIEPFHEFALIASDGLWEVFTAQEAVNFLRGLFLEKSPETRNPGRKSAGARSRVTMNDMVNDACEQLVGAALARGTSDNVSVVVIMIN